MTEQLTDLRYPAAKDEDYIAALVPADIDQGLGYHILGINKNAIWPAPEIEPEDSDVPVERTVTSHVLGYVSIHALTLQSDPRLKKEKLRLDVVEYDVALDGLEDYYAQLHKRRNPKQRNNLLSQRAMTLRTTGRKYAEPYVLMRLQLSLRKRPLVPGLRPEQSDFVTSRALLDVAGAFGTAIQQSARNT